MFILIAILQHYSQAPLVEEVAAKVAVEEEADAKHTTRKRTAEMNDGQGPSKKARVHNDAPSQVAVEEEEDAAVVAVSHVVILLFTLLFTFSLNHLTLLIPTLQLFTDSRCRGSRYSSRGGR